MEKTIISARYNFHIVSDGERFFIKATDKIFGRYSFINNLNVILSELEISQNDSTYFDSCWVANESKHFYKKIVNFLSHKSSLDYLEDRLDEDRFYGEWENRKN